LDRDLLNLRLRLRRMPRREGHMKGVGRTKGMWRGIAGALAGLVAGLVLLAAADAGAQGGRGRNYDPATVETLSGEIVELQHAEAQKGKGQGVHLLLRTDSAGTLTVHLGPASYVERQSVKLAPKDHVEVKGSRVTMDGKPVIVAAEVKKGDATLVLRNAQGVPAWSGGGGGGGGGGGRRRGKAAANED
jgi:hypothetical protein